jgi:LPS sulfotransferase NodH
MTVRFLILASMRTGSNLLNANLNQYSGIVCHGEAFNPSFVGLNPNYYGRFGLNREDVAVRDQDPAGFLDRIMDLDVLAVGLHMFPGHNTSILNHLLDDVQVRKICLRRSVIHSFISLQIAKKTDVWRVTKAGPRKALPLEEKQVTFKAVEFENYRQKLDGFWEHVLKVLAKTGQTYFPIWYRGVNDVDNMNRIVEFLGLTERKTELRDQLDKQNPEPLQQIVVNWDEMVDYARKHKLDHQI